MKKLITKNNFNTKFKTRICFCDVNNQQNNQKNQVDNDAMPIISPVGKKNVIADDNFLNMENDEEIINNFNNPDVNNEAKESEIV